MADILSDLEKLEKLSLVSKVCTELENHLGLNDKDLAEFIIHLAEKNDTFDKFKSVLIETSGDSFPDSFIANLLRIIQRMNPSMRPQQSQPNNSNANGPITGSNFKTIDPGVKKVLCPALALPNERVVVQKENSSDEEKREKPKDSNKTHKSSSSSHHHKKSKKSSKHRRRSRSRSEDRSSASSHSRSRSRTPPRKQRNRDSSRSPDLNNSSNSKRSNDRQNSSSFRDDDRNRKSDKYPIALNSKEPTEPVVGEIYDGIVSSLMQFGCFVQLKDFRKKTEGLVHISNLREEGRVSIVADVVSRHQKVKVKVLSCMGTKISLSMKEVDQFTGKDLNPQNTKRLKQTVSSYGGTSGQSSLYGDTTAAARNPDRPDNIYDTAPVNEDDDDSKVNVKVKNKQISDFEKWELQQLRNANAIQLTDMPYFDEENGILQNEEEEEIEDIEIELVEDECVFLKGYGTFNFFYYRNSFKIYFLDNILKWAIKDGFDCSKIY